MPYYNNGYGGYGSYDGGATTAENVVYLFLALFLLWILSKAYWWYTAPVIYVDIDMPGEEETPEDYAEEEPEVVVIEEEDTGIPDEFPQAPETPATPAQSEWYCGSGYQHIPYRINSAGQVECYSRDGKKCLQHACPSALEMVSLPPPPYVLTKDQGGGIGDWWWKRALKKSQGESTWQYLKGRFTGGSNLGRHQDLLDPNTNHAKLRKLCLDTPGCMAVNSRGWLLKGFKPEDQWTKVENPKKAEGTWIRF